MDGSVDSGSESSSEATLVGEPRPKRAASFRGFGRVSLLTLLSRFLGLVRDAMMASRFGNGPILDAFSVAFRIPNLARRLFGEGAMTTAFLPALVTELERGSRESAWRLATSVFVTLAISLSIVVIVGEALLIGGGALYPADHPVRTLTGLTAVMFPYLMLVCLAAQISAIFHALGRFGWPAFSPVLLNFIWIGALLLPVAKTWEPITQIYFVAWVIVGAGVLQLVWPLWVLTQGGFRFIRGQTEDREKVRGMIRLMLPILVGLSVTQINTLIDSLIAWGFSADEGQPLSTWQPLESGTASALYLGQRLYQFPLGVFGVALGTVLFPQFARHAELGRQDLLVGDFLTGMKLVTIVGIPAAVGLIITAEPLTAVLFQRGEFDAADTAQTAAIVGAYGSGVWAFCALLIVNRVYYATKDSATPMKIGLWTLFINLLFNLAFIWPLGGKGLAFATALSCFVQVMVSLWILRNRFGPGCLSPLTTTVISTLIATALMSAGCLAVLNYAPVESSVLPRLIAAIGVAVVIYAVAARVLGLRELFEMFRRSTKEKS